MNQYREDLRLQHDSQFVEKADHVEVIVNPVHIMDDHLDHVDQLPELIQLGCDIHQNRIHFVREQHLEHLCNFCFSGVLFFKHLDSDDLIFKSIEIKLFKQDLRNFELFRTKYS